MVWFKMALGENPPDKPAITAWCGGFFSRDEKGKILIGGESNVKFALRFEEYWLRAPGIPPADPAMFTDGFYTRADWIHFHPHFRFEPDWEAAKRDLASIGIDVIGTVAFATNTPEGAFVGGTAYGFGIYVGLASFAEGLSQVVAYRDRGFFYVARSP